MIRHICGAASGVAAKGLIINLCYLLLWRLHQ